MSPKRRKLSTGSTLSSSNTRRVGETESPPCQDIPPYLYSKCDRVESDFWIGISVILHAERGRQVKAAKMQLPKAS